MRAASARISEQLYRDWPFLLAHREQTGGLFVRIVHPLGGGHLPDQIACTKLLADLAECTVRDPCHRCERGGALQFQAADFHRILLIKEFE